MAEEVNEALLKADKTQRRSSESLLHSFRNHLRLRCLKLRGKSAAFGTTIIKECIPRLLQTI